MRPQLKRRGTRCIVHCKPSLCANFCKIVIERIRKVILLQKNTILYLRTLTIQIIQFYDEFSQKFDERLINLRSFLRDSLID